MVMIQGIKKLFERVGFSIDQTNIERLEAIVKDNPPNFRAHHKLSELYARQGNIFNSEKALTDGALVAKDRHSEDSEQYKAFTDKLRTSRVEVERSADTDYRLGS